MTSPTAALLITNEREGEGALVSEPLNFLSYRCR